MITLFKRLWNWLCVTRKGTIGAILCGIVLLLYVIKCLSIMQDGNSIDASLTFCVFGAVAVWLITSAFIRCNNDKLDNKKLLARIQNLKFNIGDNSFDVTLGDGNEDNESNEDYEGEDFTPSNDEEAELELDED